MKKKGSEKKKKSRILRLFQRRLLIGLIIILQLAFYLVLIFTGSRQFAWINYTLTALSFVIAIYVINTDKKFSYKLSWVVLLLAFPIFGGMLYIIFHTQGVTIKAAKRQRREYDKILEGDCTPDKLPQNREPLIRYLRDTVKYPIYENSSTEYFPSGETFYERFLEELKKAKKFIFMEYFIIAEGEMWDSIEKILIQKAAEGVDVRLMYDDVGCFLTLPAKYPKYLMQKGIKCYCFNKFRPIITTIQNNRDHRKITVIDGTTAFTGGINLADEYINRIERFGHWKDCGIMVKGDAVRSFTVIFLRMWSICINSVEDFNAFLPLSTQTIDTEGLVQPYADSPLEKENISEQIYMRLINDSKRYLYIATPYLIIDDSMVDALKSAAKSGVDVRILTPRKFDKRIIHWATISYYRELISAGVKIYEYTDGFIHSKVFVSDDEIATVGTANLDFRSLFLHFENGTVLYGGNTIERIHDDLYTTICNSTQIFEKDCNYNVFLKIFQSLLRLFAPLI